MRHASEKNGAEIDSLSSRELKRAAKRASEFVRKITPSALDSEVPAEVRTRSRLDNLATLYGRWWHKFFERLDWKAGINSTQKLFEKQLPISPDAESAIKDWNATRPNLFNNASIARFLGSDKTLFHAEFPFSWRRDDCSVLEGLIDLLMINRKAGRCLLLIGKQTMFPQAMPKSFAPVTARSWRLTGKRSGKLQALKWKPVCSRPRWAVCCFTLRRNLQTEWHRLEQLPPATTRRMRFDRSAPDDF